MPGKTPIGEDRPAAWAQVLLGGSIALAALSVVLLAWV